MKLLSVVVKSFREQIRSVWMLILSLAMGPFFIFVYYLIVESSKPHYDLLIVNNDSGITEKGQIRNYGNSAIEFFSSDRFDSLTLPFKTELVSDRETGLKLLQDKSGDALMVLPESFSGRIKARASGDGSIAIPVEMTGDLTSTAYLISAVWANELLNQYLNRATGNVNILEVKETPLGTSGTMDDFDMIVPGILIVSLIMLMFTASIAFVSEVENKTILRLRLSRIKALEFLGGIGIVQSVIGVISALLTLVTALLLGFQFQGSLLIMIIIAGLTSLSIIAFSLIIAAVTRSANEVLIVGNFPMFLFMFFTGAAFPIRSEALFTLAGYPVSLQSFMSPVHAISALNKTLVMNMDFVHIIPEITAILILTFIYFGVGAGLFHYRHLRLK